MGDPLELSVSPLEGPLFHWSSDVCVILIISAQVTEVQHPQSMSKRCVVLDVFELLLCSLLNTFIILLFYRYFVKAGYAVIFLHRR